MKVTVPKNRFSTAAFDTLRRIRAGPPAEGGCNWLEEGAAARGRGAIATTATTVAIANTDTRIRAGGTFPPS
jgi:hypothetical protein